eukprot:scaffold544355_cov29-Prasinocladus_malaysianus.AAC.1
MEVEEALNSQINYRISPINASLWDYIEMATIFKLLGYIRLVDSRTTKMSMGRMAIAPCHRPACRITSQEFCPRSCIR